MIVTVVEGRISTSKAREFEEAYSSIRQDPPPGLVTSSLLRNNKNPEIYRIQTVWESSEALDRMRSSTQRPKAIDLFQKVGAKPTLEVYDVILSVP